MAALFGYAWMCEGSSGYEYFGTQAARERDFNERLEQSPEPKPVMQRFDFDDESQAETMADEALAQMEQSHTVAR